MAPSSPSSNEIETSFTESGVLPSLVRYGVGLKSGVKSVAFWSAIVLPFLHVPLLLTGIDSRSTALAFVALLVLNVVSVIVGQHHHRD